MVFQWLTKLGFIIGLGTAIYSGYMIGMVTNKL